MPSDLGVFFTSSSLNLALALVQIQPPAPCLLLPLQRCRRQFLLFLSLQRVCHLPPRCFLHQRLQLQWWRLWWWRLWCQGVRKQRSRGLHDQRHVWQLGDTAETEWTVRVHWKWLPQHSEEPPRIHKYKYVYLADLVPAQSLHDQVTDTRARFTLFPGCELVRPKKRQIESITEWVKAFTVFTAAVALKDPAQVVELLAYQLTIINAAQSYDGLQ